MYVDKTGYYEIKNSLVYPNGKMDKSCHKKKDRMNEEWTKAFHSSSTPPPPRNKITTNHQKPWFHVALKWYEKRSHVTNDYLKIRVIVRGDIVYVKKRIL